MWIKDNIRLVIAVLIFLVGALCGYSISRYTHKISNEVVTVTPIVTTVTNNVLIPVWRTQYVYTTTTVNNTQANQLVVTSMNAVDIATRFQNDVLHFENDTLNIKISPYDIVNGVPPANITADASLYYRSWKMNIANSYKVKQKAQVLVDMPLTIGLSFNIKDSKVEANISKYILTIPFINIPTYLGLSYTLN